MPVPAFRNSRSRVRRRRSHDALKKTSSNTCVKCEAPTQPHRACASCGNYNNRQVKITQEAVEKVLEKKLAKKPAKTVSKKKIVEAKAE